MKKFLGILFLIVFTLTLPWMAVDSMAAKGGWQKWEDWENYPTGDFLSDDKWSVGNSCSADDVADVTIEDYDGSRQVKFTYLGLTKNISCYLNFNDCPERIVGIKADVTIQSCTDDLDCRARVAWHRGITSEDDYYIWEAIQVRSNLISVAASVLDQNSLPSNYDWLWDTYNANFNYQIDTIGETFTVSAIFDKPDQVTVTVEGQGTITYKVEDKMGDPIDIFKVIGMQGRGSVDVTGEEFVVYFDNIYIKTRGSCDNKKPQAKVIDPKKNMPLDACWVNITFNEPMDTCCQNIEAPAEWPIGDTVWSDDQKTFSIERSNCDTTDLPANTKIEFVVNPDGTGFMDLIGNEAKKKKLKTITVK